MPKPREDYHGTISGYNNKGCRCEACVLARREWSREYHHRILSGERGEELRDRYIERRRERGRSKEARAYQNAWKADQRKLMDALKSVPCMDCGGTFDPVCMDFDHRPGTEKLFNVGTMRGLRWDRIEAEIAKCDVVCANCHRVRTKARKQ